MNGEVIIEVTIPQFHKPELDFKIPLQFLQEVARQFAAQGIMANVYTATGTHEMPFRHNFSLVGDYTYPVFSIWHDTNFYPVEFITNTVAITCDGEKSFATFLNVFFASAEMANLVNAVLAQG